MSPEQARGKPVDKRADVWSFGVVLYEMLTGQRLFTGETVSDTLASILKEEPDWTRLPVNTPRKLSNLLHRCLRKDVRNHLHDIGDARIEIEETIDGGSEVATAGSPSPAKPAGWRRTAATAVVIALFAVAWMAMRPSDEGVLRLANPVQVTIDVGVEDFSSWSPDGRTLAYHSDGDAAPWGNGNADIWVKQVGSGQSLNRTSDHVGDDGFPSWSHRWK